MVNNTLVTFEPEQVPRDENGVTVRYWAAARAAAGVEQEQIAAQTLAELLDEISSRHGDRDRFDDVISTCSILVGETPVGSRQPHDVRLVCR